MRTNTQVSPSWTYEGGAAAPQRPLVELRRAVSTCLLWEPTFYEKGEDIGARIAALCAQVKPEEIAVLAVEARGPLKLRHVPLWLCVQLAAQARGRTDGLVRRTLAAVIQRPDELSEFLSLYWKDGKRPLSGQIKKGLAEAFRRFNAYQLAKWNRPTAIKLRDVLFLCHGKPATPEQGDLWKALIDGTLPAPDTWEVALSSGADKRETFERMLRERTLPFMALLMNVRNMVQSGVDAELIAQAIVSGAPHSKALPFRFLAAANAAPALAEALSVGMLAALGEAPRLPGRTALVIDVSGSMEGKLSAKSDLSRLDAAGALAILLREVCASVRMFTFSDDLVEVANLRGLALAALIDRSQRHSGTHLRAALGGVQRAGTYDRCIAVTDEQTRDGIGPAFASMSYLVNVAGYKPGLDVSQGWTRISGWSERVVDWIRASEASSLL